MTEPVPLNSSRDSLSQLLRYGVVGVISNASGYLAYLLLTALGGEPKLVMTLVYMIGASIGYYGNSKWSFSHQGSALQAGTRYVIAHSLGYLLNLSILHIFVDRLGYAHQWVQAIAIAIVAAFLFVLFKRFVFSSSCNSHIPK